MIKNNYSVLSKFIVQKVVRQLLRFQSVGLYRAIIIQRGISIKIILIKREIKI